jgi:hypothetical protein
MEAFLTHDCCGPGVADGGAGMKRRQSTSAHLERKRALERTYMEAFLTHPSRVGWQIREHIDEPDFLVDTSNGLIGVEITTINKDEGEGGSPLREAEAARAQSLTVDQQRDEVEGVELLANGQMRPLPNV